MFLGFSDYSIPSSEGFNPALWRLAGPSRQIRLPSRARCSVYKDGIFSEEIQELPDSRFAVRGYFFRIALKTTSSLPYRTLPIRSENLL
jgi:hypothetical protein